MFPPQVSRPAGTCRTIILCALGETCVRLLRREAAPVWWCCTSWQMDWSRTHVLVLLQLCPDVICSSFHSQGWSCVTLPTVSWLLWSAFSSACLRRCCCRASLSCVRIGRFSRLWPLCLFSCCFPVGGEWNVFEASRSVYYLTSHLSHMDSVFYECIKSSLKNKVFYK